LIVCTLYQYANFCKNVVAYVMQITKHQHHIGDSRKFGKCSLINVSYFSLQFLGLLCAHNLGGLSCCKCKMCLTVAAWLWKVCL